MATPASYSFLEIIGAPNLCGVIWSRTSGVPDPFGPAWWKPDPSCDIHKNFANFTVYTGTRQVATGSAYGSTSKNTQLRSLGARSQVLSSTYENIRLPLNDYLNIFTPNTLTRDDKGKVEIERQVMEFKKRFVDRRITMLACLLSAGKFIEDVNGAIQNPYTGSAGTNGTTLLTGIPNGSTGIPIPDTTTVGTNISLANNVGLDPLGTGTSIFGYNAGGNGAADLWSNGLANIGQQLENLKIAAEQLSGFQLKHAFYGKNVPQWLANNGYLNPYLARNPSLNDKYLGTGEIPGLWGLDWHPAGTSSYVDASGVTQQIWNANGITFSPNPDPAWYGMLEGTNLVPVDESLGQVFSDGTDIINGFAEVKGMYAYGKIRDDPAACEIIGGDTSLPCIKNPLAIFSCIVA